VYRLDRPESQKPKRFQSRLPITSAVVYNPQSLTAALPSLLIKKQQADRPPADRCIEVCPDRMEKDNLARLVGCSRP